MRAPQWLPPHTAFETSAIARFASWLHAHKGLSSTASRDYDLLYEWSVTHIEEFWRSFTEFFGVKFHRSAREVLSTQRMPGARWFTEATLNFAEHICADVCDDKPAIIVEYESGASRTHTYGDLRRDIGFFAGYLRRLGIRSGDRVVGYLPNCYENVVAFYATASIGAVWAHTGMDYTASSAADRLAQLEPRVLVAGTGYEFRGKPFDRRSDVAELRSLIPSLEHTVVVPTLEQQRRNTPSASELGRESTSSSAAAPRPAEDVETWDAALSLGSSAPATIEAVDFSHPLWVLFTSGTTGKPKGIVHGHGGALLEQLKSVSLHLDLDDTDTFFWYTTPNWMMWNVQIAGLLAGSTIVLYVGDPLHPSPRRLWDLVAQHRVSVFGTSPGQLAASEQLPLRAQDFAELRVIASTGSTLPASGNEWVRSIFGSRVQVASVSGGTDVVGLFVGATPITPVWDGEISCRSLAVALEVWDPSGVPVVDEVGELVITKPLPSMPIYFWNDPDGSKYHDAYFDVFEGVWRHGDWVTLTSHGSIIMHGRSDATLNRRGIRLGSAEIYAAVETLPDVQDSLIVGIEREGGGYWMPLFVVPGTAWQGETSAQRIREAIAVRASKHHVPDDIITVDAIPRTRTGKKMEVPVKRVLQGADPYSIGALGAVDDPHALLAFQQYTER